MDPETARKLDAISLYKTRYEAVLANADGRSVLLGYTPRRSAAGLLAVVQKNGKAVLAEITAPDASEVRKLKGQPGFSFTGTAWVVKFSGRTQREAICNGELRFISAA